MSPPVLGAVLAGGRSRRFGRDKTAAEVSGSTLLERAVETVRQACGSAVVVSARAGTPQGPWDVVDDERPDRGPLAGIEAALRAASGRGCGAALVLAADLPLVEPGVLGAILAAASPGEAVVPQRVGDPDFEPLCALYPVSALTVVERLLDDGETAARRLFETLGGRRVVLDEAAFLNVNTPEELALVLERLETSGGAR